jgi:tripartite-type tricarboxylate transporter receptor subunit TctC
MNLRFDPIKDLPSLVGMARSELVIVTGAKNKGMTLQDFIRQAKASGGKTNVGAIGTGSVNHLTGELLKRSAGFTSQHIPYPGAAPLALAVMSGEVDLAVIDMGGVLAHVAAGNLVPLAVASAKRSEFLPNVPTTVESGFPMVLSENIYGVFLPVGVPQDVQIRMVAALTTAVGSAPFQEQMRKAGLVPQLMSRADLDVLIKSQSEQFVPIARDLKIRIE